MGRSKEGKEVLGGGWGKELVWTYFEDHGCLDDALDGLGGAGYGLAHVLPDRYIATHHLDCQVRIFGSGQFVELIHKLCGRGLVCSTARKEDEMTCASRDHP